MSSFKANQKWCIVSHYWKSLDNPLFRHTQIHVLVIPWNSSKIYMPSVTMLRHSNMSSMSNMNCGSGHMWLSASCQATPYSRLLQQHCDSTLPQYLQLELPSKIIPLSLPMAGLQRRPVRLPLCALLAMGGHTKKGSHPQARSRG